MDAAAKRLAGARDGTSPSHGIHSSCAKIEKITVAHGKGSGAQRS